MKNKNDKTKQSKLLDVIIIIIIIFFALLLRIYKINNPVAEWHSWRQADTASVGREFIKNGFNLLIPKYLDLSNIQSGIYNPKGYRFVEFPIYNAIFALLAKNFAFISLEIWARIVTILFSLILIICIYYILLKEEGRIASFWGSLVIAIMPYSVYYSRTILPDMTAVSLAFLSLTILYQANRFRKDHILTIFLIIFSSITASLALLIKPFTILYTIPILYIFLYRHKKRIFLYLPFYIFFIIFFLPFILWRIWMQQFPEGIPATKWLFTSVNTPTGLQTIFFKPSFFYWVFIKRISELILGISLMSFFILGITKKPKNSLVFLACGLGSLLYLFIFQGGNVQHDYYQIMVLPTIAIFTALGISFFIEEKKLFFPKFVKILIVLTIFIGAWYTSYLQVKDYYNINNTLIAAATIIKTVTPENSLIVTDTEGDTTLLYLSDRKGYPSITKPLNKIKEDGISYFVTFNKDYEKTLKEYPLIFNSKILIFNLTKNL